MDLTSRLQNFFGNRKKVVSPIPQQQVVQSPSFGQNLLNGVSNAFKPVQQAVSNVGNFFNSNQSIQLPQVPKQINPSFKVGIPNTPLNFQVKPVEMARDIINEPLSYGANLASDKLQGIGRQAFGQKPLAYNQLKSPVSKLDMNIKSLIDPSQVKNLNVKNTPQEILGNIGGSLSGPLSLWGGGKILGTAGEGLNLAGKRALPVVLKYEGLQGLRAGGAYGLASGLDQNRNQDPFSQVANAFASGVIGAGVGGGLGAGLGSAGFAVGNVRNKALDIVKKFGFEGKEAEKVAMQLMRDEITGKFISPKSVREKPTPKGLFNNMIKDGREEIRPQGSISTASYSPSRGRQSSLSQSRITPEMRMAFRQEFKIPDVPQVGLSVKEVDSSNLTKPSQFVPDPTIAKDIIPQARPGDFSNDRSLDPRISSTFQKRNDLLKESGFTPTNLPETAKRVQDNSVLSDVKSGFESGRQARELQGERDRGNLSQRMRTDMLDRLSPVYDLVKKSDKNLPTEKNPYKQMRLLAGNSGKSEAFITQKLAPILKQEADRLPDLSTMLVLDREKELIGRGFERKRDLGQLQQGADELMAKYGPEGFKSLQESVQKVRDVGSELLNEMLNSGIIDQESFDNIKAKNEFYAPFEAVSHMADNAEKGHGTGSFNVASQDVIKRIGDYSGDVADPLETMLRKIPKVIALTEKNRAMQSLVNLRNDAPDIYGQLIQPLTGDSKPEGFGVVNVFENGTNKRYAVPEAVEGAIKNLDAETGGILLKLGSIQAKMLRTGATGLNIGFIPVNIIRDVQDSLTTKISESGVKAALSFLASYPKAIYSAAGKGDLYQEWAKSGGLQSTMTEQIFKNTPKTVNQLAGKKDPFRIQQTPKTVLNSVVSLVEFANRVGEQSTRLASFASDVNRGISPKEAAFKSRDISLDFAKAGNSVKVLNQVVPFLNAGIQGSEKLLRLYKNNPKAAIASTAVMFGVPTVALFTHNQQFQDYQDIPDAEKQTNWIILARDRTPEEIANGVSPIGIKIPKGFMARMTSTTVESAMQFMKEQDPSTFGKSTLDSVAALSPVGLPYNSQQAGQTLSTILPPWIKAGVEWTTGKNLFFGSDIVPKGLQNLPPSEQYKDNTPGIYKKAAGVAKAVGMEVSPLKLKNTVETTTGGLGRQLAQLGSTDIKGGTVDQVTRRFMDIRDGKKADAAWQSVDKEKQYTSLRNKQLKEAFKNGDMEEVKRLSEGMSSQQIKSLITNDIKKEQKKGLTPEQKAYESMTKEERARLGKERPELQSSLSLFDKASASETTPYDYGKKVQDSVEETAVKLEVETTGKPKTYNNTYYYINEKGNVASVDMDFNVKAPELTGQETLDKKLKSEYQGEITSKQNSVVKLYELKKLSAEEAQKKLEELESKRSSGGSGKGKKPKSVNYSSLLSKLKISPIHVRVTKSSRSKFNPKTVKAPAAPKPPAFKELKFKGKPLRLKK